MATQGGLPEGVKFTAEEQQAAQEVINRNRTNIHVLQNAYAAAVVGYRYGDHKNRALVDHRQNEVSNLFLA
jgi:hypothetical protein